MEENNKSEIKEKSNFEKSIIEAFKQTKVSDIYETLGIALSELPLYVVEIKFDPFLLNLIYYHLKMQLENNDL